MTDEHQQETPAWIETSALIAPTLLGAAAGLLLGGKMPKSVRRGAGFCFGALAVAALVPSVVGGLKGLVTGPKSRFGVRRRIQQIRDAGIVSGDYGHHYAEEEEYFEGR